MARAALEHEQLGQRGVTDVLTVSFSSNDSVGHTYGPESPEVRDMTRQTDRQIAAAAGRGRPPRRARATRSWRSRPTTAWHPCRKHRPRCACRAAASRRKAVLDAIEAALDAKFGAGAWIERAVVAARVPRSRRARRRGRGSRPRHAAWPPPRPRACRTSPASTPAMPFSPGRSPPTTSRQRVTRGYHRDRSGDLHVRARAALDDGRRRARRTAPPYGYDSHIPLILMGPGVRARRRTTTAWRSTTSRRRSPRCSAIEPPSGSQGRVLHEALRPGRAWRRRPAAAHTAGRAGATAPAARVRRP